MAERPSAKQLAEYLKTPETNEDEKYDKLLEPPNPKRRLPQREFSLKLISCKIRPSKRGKSNCSMMIVKKSVRNRVLIFSSSNAQSLQFSNDLR